MVDDFLRIAMNDEFLRIDIDGDRWAGLRFRTFPEDLRADLVKEIEALTSEAFGREQAAIPVRTGRTRSLLRKKVWNDPKRVKGVVDFDGAGSGSNSDFAKIGALEYGSTGSPFKVSPTTMQLDHFWDHHLNAPLEVLRKGYERPGRIMEHRFARGTLEAMRPEILQRLNEVVERATKAASDGK